MGGFDATRIRIDLPPDVVPNSKFVNPHLGKSSPCSA